jgi:2-hydroxy-6-oxonona-2,4-dienedioate hydrolase
MPPAMKSATKTLVFVHGYLGGSPQWSEQVKAFSDDFRVITPDLPGFGLNDKMQTPETINGLAQYVLDELDKAGVDRFHLVGHSMGGMIVQEMIAIAPERVDKLVLYGTGAIGRLPGRFETIEESRRRLKQDGIEATGRRIAATWFLNGEHSAGYEGCAAIATMAQQQGALSCLSAMETWSGVSSLAKIESSTLVLWGDRDRAYLWQQTELLWRDIKTSSLAVIAGCSHAVHLEKPALFNATLHDFLVPTKQ